MSDHTDDLVLAVWSALKAASPVIAGGRIFEAVPVGIDNTDSNFPYVVIGETQAIGDDTDTSAGLSDDGIIAYVTIHVWSRYRGKAEVHTVNSQIRSALHGIGLNVTGRESALCWIDSMMAMDDPDGVSRHGVITARIPNRS